MTSSQPLCGHDVHNVIFCYASVDFDADTCCERCNRYQCIPSKRQRESVDTGVNTDARCEQTLASDGLAACVRCAYITDILYSEIKLKRNLGLLNKESNCEAGKCFGHLKIEF